MTARLCACGCERELPPPARPTGQKRKWYSEACRKAQYAGVCDSCGGATNGSNGRAAAATKCGKCSLEERTTWSRESIIAAIQDWATRYGQPPAMPDWSVSHRAARRHPWRTDRYYAGGYPSHETVKEHFGSWNAGIAAAGFTPRRVGEHGHLRYPENDPLVAA